MHGRQGLPPSLGGTMGSSSTTTKTLIHPKMTYQTLATSTYSSRFSSLLQKRGFLAAGVALAGVMFLNDNAKNSSDNLHPPSLPWNHRLPWQSYDYASVRRGFFVYKNVCSTCHAVGYLRWRQLVGTALTEEEALAFAAETEVDDGPDDKGEMFTRPGKLADKLPRPYANDEAAKAGNNGAVPPDLSMICKARHDSHNYVFALLTGYRAPPAGITANSPQHYNPYMPGAIIAMEPPLKDGQCEFDDGTEATISQMAKDVTTFLAWAGEPEMDERKVMGIKALTVLSVMVLPLAWWKRFKFSLLKSRQIKFK